MTKKNTNMRNVGYTTIGSLTLSIALAFGPAEMAAAADGDYCLSDFTGALSTDNVVVSESMATDCGYGDHRLDTPKGKPSKWTVNSSNSVSGTLPESGSWGASNKINFEEDEDGQIYTVTEYTENSQWIDLQAKSVPATCKGEDNCLSSGAISFNTNGSTLIVLKAGRSTAWYYFNNLTPAAVEGLWSTDNLLFEGQQLSHITIFVNQD